MTKRFSPFPKLFSTRLRLTSLEMSDLDVLFALRSDAAVNQYLLRQLPDSKQEVEAFIAKIQKGIAQDECVYWTIRFPEKEALIGTICMWNFSEDGKSAELGYELFPEHQGKGVMSEALECVLQYAFQNLQLDRVDAYTHIENRPSRSILEKHGFVLDAEWDISDELDQKFSLRKQEIFNDINNVA